MINFNFIQKYIPRWAVLIFDVLISIFSIIIAYLLRFNFEIPQKSLKSLVFVIPFVAVVRLVSYLLSRTYAGIIRYTSTRDAFRIFVTVFFGTLAFFINNLVFYLITKSFFIPNSIILIDLVLLISVLIVTRVTVKALYFESIDGHKLLKPVLIYGGNEYGLATKRTIERDPQKSLKVMGFIDDKSQGKKIDGKSVYKISKLDSLIDKYGIYSLIITKDISHKLENEIVEICLNKSVKVQRIPQVNDWVNGKFSVKQIKQIKIESLLERDEIQLDEKGISETVYQKRVLVTGAAGSIGSEIVRQLTKYSPEQIILFDQSESQLYDLELEIKENFSCNVVEIIIGDIADTTRLGKVFENFKPQIIYHAAAYKHVPMMESNPYEAVKTNIGGTKNLADLAVEFGVEKFIMISTDKAVKPTNIMGASKRIAEIYTQALNQTVETEFITTRFGNVLGSNGSVIPRFRKQIESGGPVTVTHPEITRYFMTIPEACQLVLEASAFGNGGKIFIFDMGESIKISNLAKKMIQLSGLKLGEDIQIKYTGLRPGEKLFEELLNDKENTIPTHHPQIMIAKVQPQDFKVVAKNIEELILLNKNHNNEATVRKMKKIVPEFISKNSLYEVLDSDVEKFKALNNK